MPYNEEQQNDSLPERRSTKRRGMPMLLKLFLGIFIFALVLVVGAGIGFFTANINAE